jgi:hypothetical protein
MMLQNDLRHRPGKIYLMQDVVSCLGMSFNLIFIKQVLTSALLTGILSHCLKTETIAMRHGLAQRNSRAGWGKNEPKGARL